MMLARRDAVWAAAAGLAAFALYVRTLAPGLVDTIDTPMFQFIGRVLGVPHNPGYPLYVLLTYPFSFLPVALEDGGGAAFRAMRETDRAPLAILDGDRYGYRIEVTASGGDPGSALLALGGVPRQAIGRLRESGAAETAAVFRIDTGGLLRTPDRRSEVLLMSRDEQAQLTGAGWSPVDSDGVAAYRWMMAREARLVLPIAQEGASRIRIQALLEVDIARRAAQGGAMLIGVRLNGTQLPPQPLRPGWHVYEWPLQSGMLPRGANDVRIFVDRLASSESAAETNRSIAVADVRVVHEP